jgi:hypothetical protein
MDDQPPRQVQIRAEHATGSVTLDGRDISPYVSAYELRQRAGQGAELLLHLSPLVKDEFDGLARVVVGAPRTRARPPRRSCLRSTRQSWNGMCWPGTTCWTAAPTS